MRSKSRRFSDTRTLPNEAACLSFNGLMADNPFVHVALPIVQKARFTAQVTFWGSVSL